jgi:putative flippase GtrA
MPQHKETIHQFARFFIVGVSNTLVDFAVYLLLTRFIPFFGQGYHIYLANTVSFAAAATWSYYANRNWTFKQAHKATAGEATKFYLSTITAFLLNTAALFTVVHIFIGHDVIGKIVGSLVSMVWNFALNKLWVFKKKSV